MTSQSVANRSASALPAQAGLGLKPQHYREILETSPDLGFFEVHAENYMGAGGPPHRYLERIREHYPLSLHGSGCPLAETSRLTPDTLTACVAWPSATRRRRFPSIWHGPATRTCS